MNTKSSLISAVSIGAMAAFAGGCEPEDWSPSEVYGGRSHVRNAELERGKQAYETYCVGCHGDDGNGEGISARFMDPKPRDFRIGKLKFASVASGQIPLVDDYVRIITRGLKGTAMPSFALVPEGDRRAMAKYVLTFFENPKGRAPGATVSIAKDPYRKKPAQAIARGERLYHGLANCNSCHPSYAKKQVIKEALVSYKLPFSGFRTDMYTSAIKDSEWGAPIMPPDFLVDQIKTGSSKEDIARIVSTGIGGTAMPTWAGTLDARQLWSLAYYVESIAAQRGTAIGVALKKQLLSDEANPEPTVDPPPPPPPPPAPSGSAAPSANAAASAAPKATEVPQ